MDDEVDGLMTETTETPTCPSCGWPGEDPGMACVAPGWHRSQAAPQYRSYEAECSADGCGVVMRSPSERNLQDWVVWHVYEDHQDVWLNAIGPRPPQNDRPDLSRLYPAQPQS